jgi:glycerol uptake facilitator-like aquaporin
MSHSKEINETSIRQLPITHVELKLYSDACSKPTATAGIFCTYPQAFMTKASQIFSEFILSKILMFVIFVLKDDSNPGANGKVWCGNAISTCTILFDFWPGCFFWVIQFSWTIF